MDLDYIIETTLIDSGEFILESIDRTLIDKTKFWNIVKRSLNKYEDFVVNHKELILPISSSGKFEFEESSAPDSIAAADYYIALNYTTGYSQGSLIWNYNKPIFTTNISGDVRVSCIFKRTYVEEIVNGKVKNVVFNQEITDDRFFKLVLARFMLALGRSRRAFTISDINIDMDSSELTSEGQELWESTLEDIQINSRWYHGIM